MNPYYFVFGSNHEQAGSYVKIIATSMIKARQLMFEEYGDKWDSGYTVEEFEKARFCVPLRRLNSIKES